MSTTFTFTADDSPNVQTLQAYLSAVEEWNFERIIAQFDDNVFQHQILPTSLGRPILNKEEYKEYFSTAMPLFTCFKPTVHEIIESDNKVAVHASSSSTGISGRPYSNEYTLIFHFVPAAEASPQDGLPKIRMMKEFVDSQYTVQWFKEEREYLAKIKATEA